MGNQGLKFYRSVQETNLSGPSGMIAPDDVVLIKVNGQWKYRGCTNSDLIQGLIQAILDHPDSYTGEVVIFENGQSQGSLKGDGKGWGAYPNNGIHANANDESHSFEYVVNNLFNDPRVSARLLDPIRANFIDPDNHTEDGYRQFENVSYPCFTTAKGNRVEFKEGVWGGSDYKQNLKLINVPVLKIHGGSEMTASLKHFYGIVSMEDGQSGFRHYDGLGETAGKMVASVRPPVLNMIDAIWVSYASLSGYPPSTTFRANQILASQDPVALDYWAAKYILYPISNNPNHLPIQDAPSNRIIDGWLTSAGNTINGRGGLSHPECGILIGNATNDEGAMEIHEFTFEIMSAILLDSPSDDDSFDTCSLISTHQPSFSWMATESFAQFTILFSLSSLDFKTFGTLVTRADIPGTDNQWTPPVRLWKKILTSSFNQGSVQNIYWKVVGARADQTSTESETRKFHAGDPVAVTVNVPSTTLPMVNFNANCNVKFKIEFSATMNFTRLIGFTFSIKDPNEEAVINRALTSFQWEKVKRLLQGSGTGYFRIRAWDTLNRITISKPIAFNLV